MLELIETAGRFSGAHEIDFSSRICMSQHGASPNDHRLLRYVRQRVPDSDVREGTCSSDCCRKRMALCSLRPLDEPAG